MKFYQVWIKDHSQVIGIDNANKTACISGLIDPQSIVIDTNDIIMFDYDYITANEILDNEDNDIHRINY